MSTKKALGFALEAHKGQFRKYKTDEPYVEHVKRVVEILSSFDETDSALVCAAFLHDTVEDTKTSFQMILNEFGEEVMELVWWLTDIDIIDGSKSRDNRETRKLLSAWRLSRAPLKAKKIKLADLIDNTRDIVLNDPTFARKYLKEKEQVLNLMEERTSALEFNQLSDLFYEAKYTIEQSYKILEKEKK
jgi:(p)ppGpp synthase/HD superfamily hydrolase